MFAERVFGILTAVCLLISCMPVFAETEVSVLQAYVAEQDMDMFVRGRFEEKTLSVSVSGETAKVLGSGLLADGRIAVLTTVVVDVSANTPAKMRDSVIRLLRRVVEDAAPNESCKIVAAGSVNEVLADYYFTKNQKLAAIDSLKFQGDKVNVYDTVYRSIPAVQTIDGQPVYYRSIVVTPGISDSDGGLTAEELLLKLQEMKYPVHTVEVTAEPTSAPNGRLAALSRVSGGGYFNLTAGADAGALAAGFAISDVSWLRVRIPAQYLDGTIRQVDVTDGAHSARFDLKIPMFDVPETTPASTASSEVVTTAVSASSSENEAAVNKSEESGLPLTILIPSVAAVAVFAAIVAVVIRSKRRGKGASGEDGLSSDGMPGGEMPFSGGFRGGLHDNPHGGGETELLSMDGASAVSDFLIRIRNTENPDQIWNLGMDAPIVIGRERGCAVCVVDTSMSRRQCRIFLDGGIPMIENVSHSNVTLLNHEKLQMPQPVREGDRIQCGRTALMVDALYRSGSDYGMGNTDTLNKMTEFINV